MTDPKKALAKLQRQLEREWERHDMFEDAGDKSNARVFMDKIKGLEAFEATLLAEIRRPAKERL